MSGPWLSQEGMPLDGGVTVNVAGPAPTGGRRHRYGAGEGEVMPAPVEGARRRRTRKGGQELEGARRRRRVQGGQTEGARRRRRVQGGQTEGGRKRRRGGQTESSTAGRRRRR
jgi:hypothetical protein